MVETKQLQFFVIAVETGSFSEAAKVLYTTQSSVSKVISSLEKELGYPLFLREAKGITLTGKGKLFYPEAKRLYADFERLSHRHVVGKRDVIRISGAHSSWFADRFSEFYETKKDEGLCFLVHADTTENIVRRLRLMEDEAGFVYVFPETKARFDLAVKKYGLQFLCMKRLGGMLYHSPEDDIADRSEADMFKELRLIQSEQDEFVRYTDWQTKAGDSIDAEDAIAVITNSDYIMHRMLKNNHLANISSESFYGYDTKKMPGIPLKNPAGHVEFGVLTNKEAAPGPVVNDFIAFLQAHL